MSVPKIIRKSFNGGELGPELHYSSNLEVYHQGCKSLLNMQVTPWGSLFRRAPSEHIADIDTAVYGVPIKYVPFRFSLTEVFHAVFTDGSGSASPQASTADLIVYNTSGTVQTLTGASTKILNTPYDPDDLEKLHYIQVNDFIYMTCGGLYAPQKLNRYYDTGQAAQRWTFDEFELELGPFADLNTDTTHTLSIDVADWASGTTYAQGDVVKGTIAESETIDITHVQWTVSNTFARYDDLVDQSYTWYSAHILTAASHGLEPGDSVTLSNCNHTIVQTGMDNATATINGSRTVTRVLSETCFEVNYAIRCKRDTISLSGTANDDWTLAQSLYPFDNWAVSVNGSMDAGSNNYETVFVSQQGSNLNKPLTDSAWWKVGGVAQGSVLASVGIESNVNLFTSDDVGRLVAVKDQADERLRDAWSANTISNPVNGYGTVILKTEGGAWGGLLELQQSTDGLSTWETIGTIRSENGESNGSIEREISGSKTAIRVKLSDWSAPTGTYETEKCVWELTFKQEIFQVFKITAYTDAKNVTAEPITPLVTTLLTSQWKLGEFCESRGYPRSLAIHDERMTFGGNAARPSTVWASRTNGWDNFLETDLDTSPYKFSIYSGTIQWLTSGRNLMIGTDLHESTMGTRDSTQAITPTNIQVETHTHFGSAALQPVVAADLVFFMQGEAKRMRSSQYDFASLQYLSSEMSILAPHILQAGVAEMSFSREPWSSIFCVLKDGTACMFTYERDNRVKGWARVEFGGSGTIVSAAANYSQTGDIVAAIVKRGSVYSLESIGDTTTSTVYLDSQVQFVDQDYSAGVTVPWSSATGLTVIRDDVELTEGAGNDYTISSGTLTIPAHTDGTVTVGYKMTCDIEPTDLVEFGDHGLQRRLSKLSLYLINSGSTNVFVNDQDCPFQAGNLLAAGARLDGEQVLSVGGGTDSRTRIKFSFSHHKPFNLSAIGAYGQISR